MSATNDASREPNPYETAFYRDYPDYISKMRQASAEAAAGGDIASLKFWTLLWYHAGKIVMGLSMMFGLAAWLAMGSAIRHRRGDAPLSSDNMSAIMSALATHDSDRALASLHENTSPRLSAFLEGPRNTTAIEASLTCWSGENFGTHCSPTEADCPLLADCHRIDGRDVPQVTTTCGCPALQLDTNSLVALCIGQSGGGPVALTGLTLRLIGPARMGELPEKIDVDLPVIGYYNAAAAIPVFTAVRRTIIVPGVMHFFPVSRDQALTLNQLDRVREFWDDDGFEAQFRMTGRVGGRSETVSVASVESCRLGVIQPPDRGTK